MPKIRSELRMPQAAIGGSKIFAALAGPCRLAASLYRASKKRACVFAFVALAGCASNQQLERDWQNEKFFVKGIGWLPRAEAIEMREAGRISDVEGLDD